MLVESGGHSRACWYTVCLWRKPAEVPLKNPVEGFSAVAAIASDPSARQTPRDIHAYCRGRFTVRGGFIRWIRRHRTIVAAVCNKLVRRGHELTLFAAGGACTSALLHRRPRPLALPTPLHDLGRSGP